VAQITGQRAPARATSWRNTGRHHLVTPGDIFRNAWATSSESAYEDDPTAPVIFINGVGRICKIGAGTVQVPMIQTLQLADGPIAKAACHQIWDEKAWLDHEKLISFAARMLRGPHLREAKRLRLIN
jgi:hypothetical protein